MGRIEELAAVYERHVGAPWQRTVAGAQRVMMVVYEKELERTLRARLGEFEQGTARSGHGWKLVDCTPWFAEWMAKEEYRDAYFEDPSLLAMMLGRGVPRGGLPATERRTGSLRRKHGCCAPGRRVPLWIHACFGIDSLGRTVYSWPAAGAVSRHQEREQLPAA